MSTGKLGPESTDRPAYLYWSGYSSSNSKLVEINLITVQDLNIKLKTKEIAAIQNMVNLYFVHAVLEIAIVTVGVCYY